MRKGLDQMSTRWGTDGGVGPLRVVSAVVLAAVVAGCGGVPADVRTSPEGAPAASFPIDLVVDEQLKTVRSTGTGSGALVVAAGPVPFAEARANARASFEAAWFDADAGGWTELPPPPIDDFLAFHVHPATEGAVVIAFVCPGEVVEDEGCLGQRSVGAAVFDEASKEWRALPQLTPSESPLLAHSGTRVSVWGGGQRQLVEVLANNGREIWSVDVTTGAWIQEPDPQLHPGAETEPLVFCRTSEGGDTYALAGIQPSEDMPRPGATHDVTAAVLRQGKKNWTRLASAPLPTDVGYPELACGATSAVMMTPDAIYAIRGAAITPVQPNGSKRTRGRPNALPAPVGPVVALRKGYSLGPTELLAVHDDEVRQVSVAARVFDVSIMDRSHALILTTSDDYSQVTTEVVDISPLFEE